MQKIFKSRDTAPLVNKVNQGPALLFLDVAQMAQKQKQNHKNSLYLDLDKTDS